MPLIDHNVLFFVFALIVGSIPHKIHVCNKSNGQKGRNMEVEAYFWHFIYKNQEFHLHIIGVYLLSRRIIDSN